MALPSKLTTYHPNAKPDTILYSQLLKLTIQCDVRFHPALCDQALMVLLKKLRV